MKPSEWRWFKRRSAVEPVIGHMKQDHRMDRNYLKGTEGDKINAILAACGFNLRKLLRALLWLIFKELAWLKRLTIPLLSFCRTFQWRSESFGENLQRQTNVA
jgi:IS5 family transposase